MGRKLALVIGNNEYDDASLARLITPSEDVDDLATLLKSPDVGDFDEVIALVNEAATSVRKAIARLFKEKSPDDLLLLYFSGHGILDDQGHLYLAVKDTERDLLSGTAIPANFITGEMDRSRSKRQVLMLDCCHSGAFARGSKGVVGASVGTASAFEGTGYGRVVLTATDATQYAWEGDQVIGRADNSVFTHFMIQGLQTGEADLDHDGRITLDELYDYVYAQVVGNTPKQTPGKWSYRQQGDMVIARNPHLPVVKAAELPIELRQAIESPLANVREGAVRELAPLLSGSNASLTLAAREALQHLNEDDSRKVSIAAAEALKSAPSASPVKTPPTSSDLTLMPVPRETPPPVITSTPDVIAVPVEEETLVAPITAKQPPTNQHPITSRVSWFSSRLGNIISSLRSLTTQQQTALLTGVIVSIGWCICLWSSFFWDELRGRLGWPNSSLSIIGVSLGWIIAGVITGFVLKLVIRSVRRPVLSLGAGWPLCLFLGTYLDFPAILLLGVVVTWLINSRTTMMAARCFNWRDAASVAIASGIAWYIPSNQLNININAFVTAIVAGSILTFLLYRRAGTMEHA